MMAMRCSRIFSRGCWCAFVIFSMHLDSMHLGCFGFSSGLRYFLEARFLYYSDWRAALKGRQRGLGPKALMPGVLRRIEVVQPTVISSHTSRTPFVAAGAGAIREA